MQKLLYPRSLAVIGVSAQTKKIGHTIASNILAAGFKGQVFFINPKSKKILGRDCYPSVEAVGADIDMAIIAVPAAAVPEVLESCGRKKIENAIVVSAGFREAGSEGQRLESRVVGIAAKYGIRLLGPNCLGVLNSQNKLNASFAAGMIQPGPIGFFSQSGAICSALLDWATPQQLGFSQFISLGNMADIHEGDVLDFFKSDRSTLAVLAYLEGLSRGDAFIKKAALLTASKPLVVYKAGQSTAGSEAAASHTGSLATDDAVIGAVLERVNAIRADSLEELFWLGLWFSEIASLSGNRVAIVSNAGGPGVVATDSIAKTPLTMARLAEATKKKLKKILPPASNTHNPVDLMGDADAQRYQQALACVAADKNVDSLVVILTPQTVTEVEKTAQAIIKISRASKKPIVASFMGGGRVAKAVAMLRAAKVPVFSFPHQAIGIMGKVWRYYSRRSRPDAAKLHNQKGTDVAGWRHTLRALRQENIAKVPADSAATLLKAYGINQVPAVLVRDENELDKKLAHLRFPLVAKIESPDIIHKTEVEGVELNIKNDAAAKAIFVKLLTRVKNRQPRARLHGVVFAEQLSGRLELIIGAKRDSVFGPVVVLGLGGIYAEVLKESAVAVAPFDRHAASALIDQVRFAPVFRGVRGQLPYDRDAVIDILQKMYRVMLDFPEIKEIDFNPCLIGKGVEQSAVADARIILA